MLFAFGSNSRLSIFWWPGWRGTLTSLYPSAEIISLAFFPTGITNRKLERAETAGPVRAYEPFSIA